MEQMKQEARAAKMADFEAWLTTSLSGKSLARLPAALPGRLVFLLRDETDQLQRCEVYLGQDRIEVRGARAGAESGALLFVRGELKDWFAYLSQPNIERAAALEYHGAAQLISSLAAALELRQGQVALRATTQQSTRAGNGATRSRRRS